MRLTYGRFSLVGLLVLVGMAFGCGSNPAGPSANGGVTLDGVVLQGSSQASSDSAGVTALSGAGGGTIVTVKEEPSISAKVAGNGTFRLKNLPAGNFTLVFSVNGTVIGTIKIAVVEGSDMIKVVVQITGDSVILVDIEFGSGGDNGDKDDDKGTSDTKSCMINGGKVGERIELEGNVASGNGSSFQLDVNGNRASGPVDVDASGASYKCNGKKKATDCKASLASGDKVHVRGTLTSCTATAAKTTATEVMVQK
jgi:hypothetical protein